MKRECDSCGHKTDTENFPITNPVRISHGKMSMHLCGLCRASWAGNTVEFPEHEASNNKVLQTICKVGNMIIDEIRKSASRGK